MSAGEEIKKDGIRRTSRTFKRDMKTDVDESYYQVVQDQRNRCNLDNSRPILRNDYEKEKATEI